MSSATSDSTFYTADTPLKDKVENEATADIPQLISMPQFPLQPSYPDPDNALEDMNIFALPLGYKFGKGRSRASNGVPKNVDVVCRRSRQARSSSVPKIDCPFRAVIRNRKHSEGWIVDVTNYTHNHQPMFEPSNLFANQIPSQSTPAQTSQAGPGTSETAPQADLETVLRAALQADLQAGPQPDPQPAPETSQSSGHGTLSPRNPTDLNTAPSTEGDHNHLDIPPFPFLPTYPNADKALHDMNMFAQPYGYAYVKGRSRNQNGIPKNIDVICDRGRRPAAKRLSQTQDDIPDASSTPVRKRKSRMIDCPFLVIFRYRRRDNNWVVDSKITTHNHPPTEASRHTRHRQAEIQQHLPWIRQLLLQDISYNVIINAIQGIAQENGKVSCLVPRDLWDLKRTIQLEPSPAAATPETARAAVLREAETSAALARETEARAAALRAEALREKLRRTAEFNAAVAKAAEEATAIALRSAAARISAARRAAALAASPSVVTPPGVVASAPTPDVPGDHALAILAEARQGAMSRGTSSVRATHVIDAAARQEVDGQLRPVLPSPKTPTVMYPGIPATMTNCEKW